MSNTPKKAVDPTEAAMAAIQEALKVRDAEMNTPSRPAQPPAAPPAPAPEQTRMPEPVAAAPQPRPRQPAMQPREEIFAAESPADVEPGLPANDDWKSVGQILQSTRIPSSRPLFIAAAVLSGAWIIFAAILTAPFLPQMQEN
ncbi:MAG: hypothetical protein AB7V13_26950, partial [Pseudorhodoplanes sp.]